MPNLTDEQVAAFPEIVEAADRLAQELTSGMAAHLCPSCGGRDAHRHYCNVARLEAALAAAEPKPRTLLAAADAMLCGILENLDGCPWCGAGIGHASACRVTVLWTAIHAERKAQAAACVLPDVVNTIGAEVPPDPVGDFGEPHGPHSDTGGAYCRKGITWCKTYHDRRNACTNALAGCHPGELAKLLEAARKCAVSYTGNESRELWDALAAFKPEAKT